LCLVFYNVGKLDRKSLKLYLSRRERGELLAPNVLSEPAF